MKTFTKLLLDAVHKKGAPLSDEEVNDLNAKIIGSAIILDPNERVINSERVRELVKRLDEPSWSYEAWQELKKELGL